MKLWLIERVDDVGLDEFDSIVVAARTREDAMEVHPRDSSKHTIDHEDWEVAWCAYSERGKNKINQIGIAQHVKSNKAFIVHTSFCAG